MSNKNNEIMVGQICDIWQSRMPPFVRACLHLCIQISNFKSPKFKTPASIFVYKIPHSVDDQTSVPKFKTLSIMVTHSSDCDNGGEWRLMETRRRITLQQKVRVFFFAFLLFSSFSLLLHHHTLDRP